jgi:UDP-N-acetyl-2-amino-2-deoxyglucuronate dehydrogenase
MLCWIMGEVGEVTALCATQAHAIEIEDVAPALLRFRSGAVGVLQASTAVCPGLPESLEISGTGGTVIVEAGEIRVLELADEKGEAGAYGRGPGPVSGPAAADPAAVAAAAHQAQLADFPAALGSGRQPCVTGEEARTSLALISAVYESARTGRPVRTAGPRKVFATSALFVPELGSRRRSWRPWANCSACSTITV